MVLKLHCLPVPAGLSDAIYSKSKLRWRYQRSYFNKKCLSNTSVLLAFLKRKLQWKDLNKAIFLWWKFQQDNHRILEVNFTYPIFTKKWDIQYILHLKIFNLWNHNSMIIFIWYFIILIAGWSLLWINLYSISEVCQWFGSTE